MVSAPWQGFDNNTDAGNVKKFQFLAAWKWRVASHPDLAWHARRQLSDI
jgi:hypothetical protein